MLGARDRLLFQRYRKPAQIRVCQQPDLAAAQFQHGALLVGQQDRACASPDRKTRACRTVDARNVRRPPDVAHPSAQHSLRAAEDEAVVQPASRERVAPAVEVLHQRRMVLTANAAVS